MKIGDQALFYGHRVKVHYVGPLSPGAERLVVGRRRLKGGLVVEASPALSAPPPPSSSAKSTTTYAGIELRAEQRAKWPEATDGRFCVPVSTETPATAAKYGAGPESRGASSSSTSSSSTSSSSMSSSSTSSSSTSSSSTVRLFSCPPQSGLLVPLSRLLPYSREEWAAVKFQCFWRGHRAREAYHEQVAFVFWNELESYEEKETLAHNRDVGTPTLSTIRRQLDEEELEELEEFSSGSSNLLQVPTAVGSIRPRGVSSSAAGGGVGGVGGGTASPLPPSAAARRRTTCRKSLFRQSLDASAISKEEILPGYKGPHLTYPVTRQFALDLLDYYREFHDDPLPRKYAFELMIQIEEHLKDTVKGAVVTLEIPKKPEARLVLVGDTHGQLNDVLWLFYKFGPPSLTNVYLFNGDIADRGSYAVEIFLILFAFKLANPGSVIINRGNHESGDMNEVYGFAQEVRRKYGGLIYQKFQDIFHLLPLCIVLESRVLVVHGGLFRKDNVSLKSINNINRNRPCPASPTTYEDTLMFDLLWSDPQQSEGRGFSSRGAECISFGPDVTDSFLTKNNLEVCIRSHQVPSNLRGFEPVHSGRCVTLFSASNYCGTTNNYGGVIIFEPDMSFEIQEYIAPSLQEIYELHKETQQATMKVLTSSRMKEVETKARRRRRRASKQLVMRDIVQKVSRMICEKKQELWWFFFNQDENNQGWIVPQLWRDACAATFPDSLPWVFLMKTLKVPAADGRVYYNEFLARFKIEFRPPNCKHENWRQECVSQVFESILGADLSLKETLMVFDRNCDGTVSFREFNELLSELDIGLSEPQVKILMRIITANHSTAGDPSARIDAAEFLGRFKVVYSNLVSVKLQSHDEEWVRQALHSIGKAILADRAEAANRHYDEQEYAWNDQNTNRRRSSAVRAVALFQKFKEYNEEGDGFLSYNDFVTAIQQLPQEQIAEELGYELTQKHIYKLAEAIDSTGSGKINYLEFLQAFYVVDSSSKSNVAEELWGHICASLFKHKDTLRRAIHQFDVDLTGRVSTTDFRSALVTLNTVLARIEAPLTEDQIDQLVNCIDLDPEGMVEYEEFLNSFMPTDTLFRGTELMGVPPTISPSGNGPSDVRSIVAKIDEQQSFDASLGRGVSTPSSGGNRLSSNSSIGQSNSAVSSSSRASGGGVGGGHPGSREGSPKSKSGGSSSGTKNSADMDIDEPRSSLSRSKSDKSSKTKK